MGWFAARRVLRQHLNFKRQAPTATAPCIRKTGQMKEQRQIK